MKKEYPRKKIRTHKHKRMRFRITGVTLVSASTLNVNAEGTKTDAAKAVGEAVAKKALDAGITKVVFDRGGNIYHGRIKALAEGAREAGLDF